MSLRDEHGLNFRKKVLQIYGKNKDKVTKGKRVKKLRIYTFQHFLDDQLMKREICGTRDTNGGLIKIRAGQNCSQINLKRKAHSGDPKADVSLQLTQEVND